MDISFFLLPLNILSFVVGVSLIARSWPYRRRSEIRWLLLLVASICLISFCGLNIYTQGSFEQKVLFSRFRFLGLSMLAPSWLMFLVSTYGGGKWKSVKPLLLIFFGPALITVSMTLIPAWNDLLVQDFAPFQWKGFSLVQYKNGLWFPFHMTSSTLSALLALGFALYTAATAKKIQRRQLLILALGGFISLAVDRYCVQVDSTYRWAMLSGATFLFTEAAILYAIIYHGLLDLSSIAKDKIFKDIPDPILILDKQQLLLDFNQSAQDLFNLRPSDLLRPWNGKSHGVYLDNTDKPSEWILENEKNLPRFFSIRTQPLNSDQSFIGKIVVFQEFTERKRLEMELNNHLEFKARLLTLIAHDFSGFLQTQTLLTSSLSNLDGPSSSPEFRKETGALMNSVFASKDFMTNILNWAKTQSNSFQPLVKPFEFNILIHEVIESQRSLLDHKKIQPAFTSNRSPLIYEGDSLMIESVIRNILNNSIRASRDGSYIGIQLFVMDHHIQVKITNEGHGLSEFDLLSLNKSLREASARYSQSSEGFGIGLTIAQKFIDLHRGTLEISSIKDLGTTVTLTLPL